MTISFSGFSTGEAAGGGSVILCTDELGPTRWYGSLHVDCIDVCKMIFLSHGLEWNNGLPFRGFYNLEALILVINNNLVGGWQEVLWRYRKHSSSGVLGYFIDRIEILLIAGRNLLRKVRVDTHGKSFFPHFFPDIPTGVSGNLIVFGTVIRTVDEGYDAVGAAGVLDVERYLVFVIIIGIELEYINVFDDIAR